METLHCPFDKGELEERSEYHNERWYQCSKCGLTYNLSSSQESIDWEAEKYVENWKTELETLDGKKRNLLEKLRIAKKANLLDDVSVLFQ